MKPKNGGNRNRRLKEAETENWRNLKQKTAGNKNRKLEEAVSENIYIYINDEKENYVLGTKF